MAGAAALPLSAKAARIGLRFLRHGVVVPGEIVDVERTTKKVMDEGVQTIVESSAPVVAYRTADGRDLRESAIVAVTRTMATRRHGEFVPVSQRGQYQGRSWEPGETVRIRYLPDEPERFRIEGKPAALLLWFIPMSLCALFFLIALTLILVALL